MMKLKLISHVQEKISISKNTLSLYIKRLSENTDSLNNLRGIIEINILNSEEMRRINREYRKKDYATDVLSFEYLDSPSEVKGEIFICLPVAARQASENRQTLKKELEILLVHGLLHIAGYDHNNDNEEIEMENLAKKILSDL